MSAGTPAEDRVALVAEIYRLFGAGRTDETFALFAEDVVIREPGDPALLAWAGDFRGHAGLRRFYAGLGEALTEIRIDPESLRFLPVGDDQVLATGTERGVAAATGRAYETESAWVWTVRDGRAVRMSAYHDTAAMHAAFA